MVKAHGIHHITAIAGRPQENLDFYTRTLGLRLVKKSINQDVPDTYHLFFADGEGNPGTDITFFPWPQMGEGRIGLGVWGEVSFTVPHGSLEYWERRLKAREVMVEPIQERFGERVLPFYDGHGMALSLTESDLAASAAFSPWEKSPVPADSQIRSLGSVRLTLGDPQATANFLNGSLGFENKQTDGKWQRFVLGEGAGGQRVDIRTDPDIGRGGWGVGSVHHVAFRVKGEEDQLQVWQQIREAGGRPTEVIDRFWFKSVYVREPSGALVEVATDGPGFGVDEASDTLGEKLILPPWYEGQRRNIEVALPPLEYDPAKLGDDEDLEPVGSTAAAHSDRV
jgi:glyoxalase family protein